MLVRPVRRASAARPLTGDRALRQVVAWLYRGQVNAAAALLTGVALTSALVGCSPAAPDGGGGITALAFIGQRGGPNVLTGTNTGPAPLPVVIRVGGEDQSASLSPGGFSVDIATDPWGPVEAVVLSPDGTELGRAPRATDRPSKIEELTAAAGGAELELEVESDAPAGSTVMVEVSATGGVLTDELGTVRKVVSVARETEMEFDGLWQRPCTIMATPIHPVTSVPLGTPKYVRVPLNC